MRYIISDIHGCYNEYMELLDKIKFSDEDELVILGDAVDKGPEPIKVLKDIMNRQNAVFIIGNHDFIMYTLMRRLAVEITEENADNYLEADDILDYNLWLQDGGWATAEQFRALSKKEKEDVLDYLSEALLYETIEYGGKRYILVHAGLANFSPDKDLDEYDLYDFLGKRADYSKRYYPDENTYLVTGHTPTIYIEGWGKTEVYRKNGHIAIDCCCVGGGKLAAYCIETEEVTYVEVCKENEIPMVVMHLTGGEKAPEYNETGLRRLQKIADYAEMLHMKIAFENTKIKGYLDYVMENIANQNVGICFDSGHYHVHFDDDLDFAKFKNRIFAVHLHDNDKSDDLHLIPFDGTLDWKKVVKNLKENHYNGPITMELCYRYGYTSIGIAEFYRKGFEAGEKLREMFDNV